MNERIDAEVVIVGAGVAGLGVGWQLAEAGCAVCVVERDRPGAGASGAAAGMLAPTAEVKFEEEELLALGRRSLGLYPEFVARLERAAEMDVDYRDEGTLVVGVDRDDAEALDRLFEYHRELGLDVQRLNAAQARKVEPGLSPTIHSALRIKTDHQVAPRRLVRALERAFEQAGGRLVCGRGVERVCMRGGRACGVELDDGRGIDAEVVLLAAGAWTPQIKGVPAGIVPHLRPVRGQMIALRMGTPAICEHVIRAPDAYLVPKSDGRLIIGATSEERGFDASLTAGGIFELLRGAWETLPGVYDLAIDELWTGFRPVTLDNQPRMGPTGVDGLWLATGHGRNGILLAASTAMDLSRSILEGRSHPALEAFAPRARAR